MTSKGEMIGAALAKAVKATTGITSAKLGASMYRTNIKDVPKVEGLKRDDGWIDMQVQFLIDKKSAGADNVVGWTVLKPGASHERHLHRNCDEFFIVLKGQGHIITDKGLEPSVAGRRTGQKKAGRVKRPASLSARVCDELTSSVLPSEPQRRRPPARRGSSPWSASRCHWRA